MEYKFVAGYIWLTHRLAFMLLTIACPFLASGQNGGRLTGKVVDSLSGSPLPGVSVTVKGSQQGAGTDLEGAFTIVTTLDQAVLVFSMLGYQTKEVAVSSGQPVTVQLAVESESLEEIVVVGYGTQRRVNLTGAVATASGEELNKRVVTNPASLLQGKLPGISVVQNSGEPGNEGVSLQVRGMGTFSGAGNDPLVIVDGIPGDLSALNPNDIASVSILKDAASAAIYGTRAANGVILVTTRKGREGKLQLEYNYNIGITNPTKTLDLITNSVEYMELYNKALIHSGQPAAYPEEFIGQYRNPSDPELYPSVDWQDILFNTAYVHNHYLSLNGGNDNTTYNVGLGFVDEPGTMLGFENQKYTLQMNLDSKLSKRIDFGASLTFNYNDRQYPRQGSSDQFLAALTQGPMYGPVLPDGSGRYTYRGDPYVYHNKNPVAIAENVQAIDRSYYLQNNIFVNVNLLDNLTWQTRGGFNFNFYKIKDFRPLIPQYDWFTGEFATMLDVGEEGLVVSDVNSIYPIIYSQLTYTETFSDHNFKVMGGVQQEYFKEENLEGYRRGFPSNDLREIDAGGTDGQRTNGTAFEWSLRSYFGRLNYDYKGKYLFEANVRYDGSSRFAEDTRWGLFPSFSAGWRIGQEAFMGDITWLSDLKLRASWGRLGNQNIGVYPYQNILSLGYNYPFDNSALSAGVRRTRLVDEDIRWETTQVFDLGLDLSVFNNKLQFTGDWFSKKTFDILRSAQLPGWVGLDAPVINGGTMMNKGWELSLQYNDKAGDFGYGIGANFQTVKNELVKYGERQIGGNTINEEGRPWQTYYVYDWIGIFQSEEEIANSPTQPFNPKPGDLKFRDVNGDGVINPDDRTYFDGAFPEFNYSFNFNASYKNFDFTAFFYGVQGRRFYVTGWGMEPFTQSTPPTAEWRDAWSPENPTNELPHIFVSGYAPVSSMPSTFFLQNASFFRLKSVQLGYNFPASWLKTAGISGLRIYFAGDNLFTFTDYPGLDPERTGGGRFVNYPQNKVYSFGVKLRF